MPAARETIARGRWVLSGYMVTSSRAHLGTERVRRRPPGGAAGPDDFVAAVLDGGADAVLAASIFHRRTHAIAEVKLAMAAAGLSVRLVPQAVA